MRAADIRKVSYLAHELANLYRGRAVWDRTTNLIIKGDDDEYWDEVEVPATPDIIAKVKTVVEAQIADLEQQLDALGVKDLWTLAEPDADEDDDEEVEAAAA